MAFGKRTRFLPTKPTTLKRGYNRIANKNLLKYALVRTKDLLPYRPKK